CFSEGKGGWDTSGCWRNSSSSIYTSCLCDHLTHFAALLDLSKSAIAHKDEHILTFITYLGCGISSIFLGISVLTYTAFEALRRDYPSKILINLALALLGLNLDFLVNSWMASLGISELCVLMAASLHYFLLASFTWMGLEAVHMYLSLVRVFSIYVPSYLFKLCLLGWGLPLLIVVLVLAVGKDAYGQDSNFPKPFDDIDCWFQDDVTFYVTVVAYVFLVLLCNSMVFIMVLYQIRILRAKEPAGSHGGILSNLRGAAGLSSLLGLTWTLAFFTWGPVKVPFLYLFSVLNTLQGFFIFLFYCLMKENVRRQWRIHLFGACCRLKEYSGSTALLVSHIQAHDDDLFAVILGCCNVASGLFLDWLSLWTAETLRVTLVFHFGLVLQTGANRRHVAGSL
uniref:G-protein coupled receptors family 2 profile 2 domain-containing protein n=1 Tax=Scleropages formosus TaxID=113540 RepID=A0A8C9RNS3_SCLFO